MVVVVVVAAVVLVLVLVCLFATVVAFFCFVDAVDVVLGKTFHI